MCSLNIFCLIDAFLPTGGVLPSLDPKLGGNLENLFRENPEAKGLELPDVLVVDPPRAGLHIKTIEDIIEKSPKRIVYVSCNPASQARDVALLCNEKYELKKLRPVDMFPHTPHVENVVTLILK